MHKMEVDSNGNSIRDSYVDEYGNEEVLYENEELKEYSDFGLFRSIICGFKLELNMNRQLYKNGSISKELYEKVENIILERMKPWENIMEV